MASYLVTGSSRGLGLAMVTILASKPASEIAKVFASGRSQSESLKKLIASSNGRVEWVPLEVGSSKSVKTAVSNLAESLGNKGLDVLINNVGVGTKDMGKTENMTDLDDGIRINVYGTHEVTSAFLPLLRKGTQKKIINITTSFGSISMARTFTWAPAPAYKISKAALNMLTVQYALDLEEEGFTVVAFNPGWCKTDMSGGMGDLTPEEGAQGALDVAFRITPKDNAKFINILAPGWEDKPAPKDYAGQVLTW